MRLADDDVREVLARALEIQSTTLHGDAFHSELEAVIQAAEEVGIARAAVERALRERLNLPLKTPAAGDLTFAKSADDKYYVAEIVTATADGFRVRFLRGGEHTVSLDELRPCSFLPGERVVCPWPWWGPWTCTVLSYDASSRRVKVTDGWGDNREFRLEEVWLNSQRKNAGRPSRTRIYTTLIGAGAALGALIGGIVTALLL
jgi:hypothetical protein